MTRKDYRLIAMALKATRPAFFISDREAHAAIQWGWTVAKLANDLDEADPKFQRLTFLVACGYQDK